MNADETQMNAENQGELRWGSFLGVGYGHGKFPIAFLRSSAFHLRSSAFLP